MSLLLFWSRAFRIQAVLICAVVLGPLLTYGHAESKSEFPASLDSWQTTVSGVPVTYHFLDLGGWPALAYTLAEWRTGNCHVYLDVWLFNSPEELVNLILHEVGHCVDIFALGFDHNGLGWGDCTENRHDCRPEEQYAEAWRKAYLSACGTNLYVLGFSNEQEHDCELPDPRAVTTNLRAAP